MNKLESNDSWNSHRVLSFDSVVKRPTVYFTHDMPPVGSLEKNHIVGELTRAFSERFPFDFISIW